MVNSEFYNLDFPSLQDGGIILANVITRKRRNWRGVWKRLLEASWFKGGLYGPTQTASVFKCEVLLGSKQESNLILTISCSLHFIGTLPFRVLYMIHTCQSPETETDNNTSFLCSHLKPSSPANFLGNTSLTLWRGLRMQFTSMS